MIDTVCLLIPRNEIMFAEGTSSWELYSQTEQYNRFIRNPSKAEKDTGKYFPRLTSYKQKFGQDASVRIEFSAPKLLYHNNLDELEDTNFSKVVETLRDRLKRMGVLVTKSVIETASVSSVHFSRNIELKNGYTASYLISEMNKVDLRKSFDFAKTRFMNDGQSLYAHTTSHQMVIYDKMADLKKDTKRAIDKTQTPYQRSLSTALHQGNKKPEILRFEIRLAKKQKMNKVLMDLGYEKNPTFKYVFNAEMSQKVVYQYWQNIILNRSKGLFTPELSIKEILQVMFLVDHELKPKKAIYLLGLYMLARDEQGMRQLRSIVTKRVHDRTWYRMVADMDYASDLITKNNLRDWVIEIDTELINYKAYKTKKYEKNSV